MCNDAVEEEASSLKYVSDYFVTQKQLKVWLDDDEYWYDDKVIEWYEGHQKRKAQKAKIKDELVTIAWHSSRWWDWCIPENKKKEAEKLWK